MLNCRQIATVATVALLVLCAGLARADDPHVVSLTCRGMKVQKAISILQGVSDLRVVVDPKVADKRITLTLKDLPAEDALRTIVAAAGLTATKVGNAFVVEPIGGGSRAGKSNGEAVGAGGRPTNAPPAVPVLGGIVRPDQPEARSGTTGLVAQRQAPVAVSPAVLAALEHTVEVDVKNGPLTEVMAQLSRSAGIEVTADSSLSAGLVATVGLHGIPLRNALEMVAGQTGLQISPRANGVAFVTPGFSLDTAQAQARRAPSTAKHVDQGQLWTAEWANVLTSGFSAFDGSTAIHSLRRQSLHPDGRQIEFKPRTGRLRQVVPGTSATRSLAVKDAVKRSAQPSAPALTCPHCGRLVPVKAGLRCAGCGRVLAAGTLKCPACGSKPVRARIVPARCPSCHQPLENRRP